MDEIVPAGTLQVEVAFSRRELHAAQRASLRVGPLWRRPVVMLPVIVVASGLVAYAAGMLQHLHPPGATSSTLGTICTIGLAIWVLRYARRTRAEQQRHEAHPDVYTLSDAGLEISGAEDLVTLSWSSMTRVHETDRFFLFVAGSEVQYLPKRALDPAQVEAVRGLIRRHAPTEKALLSPGS